MNSMKEYNNKVINDHNINGINDNLKRIKINAKSKKKNVKFTAINFEGNKNKDNKKKSYKNTNKKKDRNNKKKKKHNDNKNSNKKTKNKTNKVKVKGKV